jgi:hypothetical protein
MTDKSAAAIREFITKYVNDDNEPTFLSDLTALISEHYYPKEFVEWKDKKDLRYSSLHNRYYSDTDNGMREFTLDELFNYWKENER